MKNNFVFVYGTLRRGSELDICKRFPDSSLVSEAAALGVLYDLGAYPGLFLNASGICIKGEVYKVTAEILKELDEIEGFNRTDLEASYYFRKNVEVSLEDRTRLQCWVYECNPKKFNRKDLISSGDWIDYAKTKTNWPKDTWPDE